MLYDAATAPRLGPYRRGHASGLVSVFQQQFAAVQAELGRLNKENELVAFDTASCEAPLPEGIVQVKSKEYVLPQPATVTVACPSLLPSSGATINNSGNTVDNNTTLARTTVKNCVGPAAQQAQQRAGKRQPECCVQ
eukprot:TRINITY_DN11367_c0_g1_i3.p1 TRINITY_DN11367_c0_g1~~TRINITY_DN11367_c0_g1_i3.p1  ORF type:complete len:137 (-),score=32.69 TRINITY_DN11367_c0_g1_i3:83-493(-)